MYESILFKITLRGVKLSELLLLIGVVLIRCGWFPSFLNHLVYELLLRILIRIHRIVHLLVLLVILSKFDDKYEWDGTFENVRFEPFTAHEAFAQAAQSS